jgi:hypothetical protein
MIDKFAIGAITLTMILNSSCKKVEPAQLNHWQALNGVWFPVVFSLKKAKLQGSGFDAYEMKGKLLVHTDSGAHGISKDSSLFFGSVVTKLFKENQLEIKEDYFTKSPAGDTINFHRYAVISLAANQTEHVLVDSVIHVWDFAKDLQTISCWEYNYYGEPYHKFLRGLKKVK